MVIFDMFKKGNKSEVSWTIRIGNDEYLVDHPEAFKLNMDNFMTDLEMGDIEFIVLSPSETINNKNFLQAVNNEDGYIHVEVGLNERNKLGRPKILYKDGVSTGDCLDMFVSFYETGDININGWQELE
jgi:hypothetical protein